MLTSSSGPISCTYVLATLQEPGAAVARGMATPAAKHRPPTPATAPPPPPPPTFDDTLPELGRVNSTQAVPNYPGRDSLSLPAIPQEMQEEQDLLAAAETNDDTVTAEPPAKRKKRCFEKSFAPSRVISKISLFSKLQKLLQALGYEKVLAPDSDVEE